MYSLALSGFDGGSFENKGRITNRLQRKYKSDRTLRRGRANAGLDVFRKHKLTDPGRIAAIGYCFGGTAVLELARSPSSELDAQAIWESLIVQAQEWNKTAGTFTAQNLPERLRSAIQPRRSRVQQEAVSRLQEHSALVLEDIHTELAPGIHLPRTVALDLLADAIESSQI